MKYLFSLFVTTALLFGLSEDMHSFSASFEQTITDEQNSSIAYTGTVLAKEPDLAYWHYQTPVDKSVYYQQQRVVMIEPDLEQAIIKEIDQDIDLLAILSHAKPISDNRYMARYESMEFIISVDNNVISSITYKDKFDNNVLIVFSDQKINIPLENSLFEPVIPVDFDRIQQ